MSKWTKWLPWADHIVIADERYKILFENGDVIKTTGMEIIDIGYSDFNVITHYKRRTGFKANAHVRACFDRAIAEVLDSLKDSDLEDTEPEPEMWVNVYVSESGANYAGGICNEKPTPMPRYFDHLDMCIGTYKLVKDI